MAEGTAAVNDGGREEGGRTRVAWTVDALGASGLDALICTLPEDILLLSGYWPVVGTAIAVASRRGVAVLAPEDERDLAEGGWADEVRTYSPGSLARLADPAAAVGEPLAALLRERDLENGRLGLEDGPIYEESSYAAMYLYGGAVRDVIGAAAPGAELVSGMSAIARLRSVMTPFEVNRVRLACRIAGSAFTDARRALRPGVREPEGAVAVQSRLFTEGMAHPGVSRAGGFAWCMSGPNSALAGIAYARTRNRALQQGDLVLLHCNSYVDGYWTDITRTYVLGNPDHRQQAMYEAIFAARAAALDALRPGVTGAEVDAAAREVLTERGFGQEFTHGLGHNVGFSAISGEFPPRLHPASTDRLQAGMTFNIEPSIYIEGYGGLRHCDVVTLRDEGPDVLTDFGSDPADLILPI